MGEGAENRREQSGGEFSERRGSIQSFKNSRRVSEPEKSLRHCWLGLAPAIWPRGVWREGGFRGRRGEECVEASVWRHGPLYTEVKIYCYIRGYSYIFVEEK